MSLWISIGLIGISLVLFFSAMQKEKRSVIALSEARRVLAEAKEIRDAAQQQLERQVTTTRSLVSISDLKDFIGK